jgi:hypothetical protein
MLYAFLDIAKIYGQQILGLQYCKKDIPLECFGLPWRTMC